ncbi:nucleotidyltransferase domain-containing protein [Hydrogenimonas thermophila]|uniref:nucleotidyltransferase domain-containing protein n=1 Tax=Hydrogenimonas thermophila TaxID=223786 RepID=UPI002937379F|nr:nucleotidyltransferase domain-containing protein [Hydrogenimonas thermophila]WOE69065.1 nucleotidyltransferase domain-containing protein [Hydrogenimonas thermophila]WOE71575.1 nucleotidyltransferase domain-containing protein [Hydrogenimonas thermophila]
MKKNKIEIEKLKQEIVERLKPLEPEKIILFGSYAYGEPNEDSDIDLFLIKDIEKNDIRTVQIEAGVKLFELIKKYKIGFDVFVDSKKRVQDRIDNVKDQFYSKILTEGKVIYGK